MKEKLKQLMQRRAALLIALALIAAAGSGLFAYAEFTKSYRAKRVIAAYRSEGMLFSSNYLTAEPDEIPIPISISDAERTNLANVTASAFVTVCKFPQSDPYQLYSRDITYTLTWRLVRLDENGDWQTATGNGLPTVQVFCNGAQEASLSGVSGTLTALKPEDKYEVKLSKNMVGSGVYLEMTATPTPTETASYPDLSPISGRLHLVEQLGGGADEGWTLTETDVNKTTSPNDNVNDYSGFNFRLSGTGKGQIALRWNSGKLAISEIFRNSVKASSAANATAPTVSNADTNGYKTLSFYVDSDEINSYDIQFYINNGSNALANWGEVAVQYVFPAPDNLSQANWVSAN